MWRSSFLVNFQACRIIAGNCANKWTPSQVFFNTALHALPMYWLKPSPNQILKSAMFSTPVGNPDGRVSFLDAGFGNFTNCITLPCGCFSCFLNNSPNLDDYDGSKRNVISNTSKPPLVANVMHATALFSIKNENKDSVILWIVNL